MRAQPLDRSRERELGAAQPLDEVAAPRGAQRLQGGQLRVHGAKPPGDALPHHGLARHDAVALEQQLGARRARSFSPGAARTALR